MRLGWRTHRADSLKLAEIACTRIENARKVRKKTFVYTYVAVIAYVQLWGHITDTHLYEPL